MEDTLGLGALPVGEGVVADGVGVAVPEGDPVTEADPVPEDVPAGVPCPQAPRPRTSPPATLTTAARKTRRWMRVGTVGMKVRRAARGGGSAAPPNAST